MKIAFIGSRGVPASYGGFETFVEELAKGLVESNEFKVTVVGDIEQKEKSKNILTYNGIDLIYSKYSKPKQAFMFYLDSMIKVCDSDIVYCCGVGNAFILPFFFWKKIVTNPDGIGWKRVKWSKSGRKILKLMFYLAAKFSPYIVCDSIGVEKVFREKFSRRKNITTIEYGAYLNRTVDKDNDGIQNVLKKYDLVSAKYHLIVSRLEPENNVDMIIEGYCEKNRKYPLIVVGNTLDTEYVRSLTLIKNDNVIFIGGIYNKFELDVVRSKSFSYFHGHSVGGTNPSLLEAMASKNLCICHDNEFNKGIVAENGFYFDSASSVSNIIEDIEDKNYQIHREGVYKKVIDYYNWDNIINKYRIYFKALSTSLD